MSWTMDESKMVFSSDGIQASDGTRETIGYQGMIQAWSQYETWVLPSPLPHGVRVVRLWNNMSIHGDDILADRPGLQEWPKMMPEAFSLGVMDPGHGGDGPMARSAKV